MEKKSTKIDPRLFPLQPVLEKMRDYRSALMTWNPYVLKNKIYFYQFRTDDKAMKPQRLVSTGCTNFLFRCNPDAPHGVVSGIPLTGHTLDLKPNTTYFGFYPFTTKGLYCPKDGWEDLADREAPLQEQYEDNGTIERIANARSFDACIAEAMRFARTTLIDDGYHPDFIEYAQIMICNSRGNLEIKKIYDYTGYTDRYCRKKFIEACGVSMKTYANIMRFQNVIRDMEASQQKKGEPERDEIMNAVFANGYYDQPHLIREFRRFADDTPARFNRCVFEKK